MIRPMRYHRLASVASVSLILSGCAALRVGVEPGVAAGRIAVRPGRPGLVIAAPQGTSDSRTADIAAELARRTGFGLVIAPGPSFERDPADGATRPDEAYERRVRDAAQGALAFYTEIHGDNRRESAGRIEIATVGVDHDQAVKLGALLELIRDAYLRGRPDAPRLDILVEPADRVVYAVSGAKRLGMLRLPARALHIELPWAARREGREVYTSILADFLSQAVAFRTAK